MEFQIPSLLKNYISQSYDNIQEKHTLLMFLICMRIQIKSSWQLEISITYSPVNENGSKQALCSPDVFLHQKYACCFLVSCYFLH